MAAEYFTIIPLTALGSSAALFLGANASAIDNTVSGGGYAGIQASVIYLDSGYSLSVIQGNLVSNNTWGIELNEYECNPGSNLIIANNTITDNSNGITANMDNTGTYIIENNNIYGNNYNFYLLGTNIDVNATDNWWGTTDNNAISQSIYDFNKDFNLGTVVFSPFLTER